jgi:propanediol dehydratase small subunit
MLNGYALATSPGLQAIGRLLRSASESVRDALRAELAVDVQRGADVTDLPPERRHTVTQVFCSALPVAYSEVPASLWEPFARPVLEAAYEATMLAAIETRMHGGAPTVLLTRLGGGAFGNAPG